MKRRLSRPTQALLNQGAVGPGAIDAAIDDLVRIRASAVLRANHPIIQEVRRTTGVNLVQIARRSRYLLIDIEQQTAAGPSWQYREVTPRSCVFACRGELPAAIEVALNGELLEALVVPAAAMKGVRIGNVAGTGDGWFSVDVTPDWLIF